MEKVLLKPGNFDSNPCFIGSTWPSREAEIVASSIVTLQKRVNPDKWTPFSPSDYKKLCGRYVSENELDVIEMLAGVNAQKGNQYGGSDYLNKTENGDYLITPKFIEMISKFSINN